MLDLDDLHFFYWVGKLGGVGAAARELKVTQPAVSQRLKRLEKRLGRKLYGRAGQRLALTEDGKKVLGLCEQAFGVLDTLEAAMEGKDQPLLGLVKCSSLSEFSKAVFLPLIQKFRRGNPSVEFDVQYRHPYETIDFLCRHEVDFAFTTGAPHRPQVQAIPVFKEEIVCIGPGPAREFSWKDMETVPWLTFGAEDVLRFELEEIAAKQGIHLSRPAVQVADMESILRLSAQGMGYAMAPSHALKIRTLDGLAVHRLPVRELARSIHICRLKTVPLGKAAQAFWDFLLKSRPLKAAILEKS